MGREHRSIYPIIIERKGPRRFEVALRNLRELRGPDGTRSKDTAGIACHCENHMRLSRTGLGHQGSLGFWTVHWLLRGAVSHGPLLGALISLGLSGVRC